MGEPEPTTRKGDKLHRISSCRDTQHDEGVTHLGV